MTTYTKAQAIIDRDFYRAQFQDALEKVEHLKAELGLWVFSPEKSTLPEELKTLPPSFEQPDLVRSEAYTVPTELVERYRFTI
jgi:hypothetical protein